MGITWGCLLRFGNAKAVSSAPQHHFLRCSLIILTGIKSCSLGGLPVDHVHRNPQVHPFLSLKYRQGVLSPMPSGGVLLRADQHPQSPARAAKGLSWPSQDMVAPWRIVPGKQDKRFMRFGFTTGHQIHPCLWWIRALSPPLSVRSDHALPEPTRPNKRRQLA